MNICNISSEYIDCDIVNILLYCDDIVLLTENEDDLQFLLQIVERWCRHWQLDVNLTKTDILHVRNKRKSQSWFVFLFNNRPVNYCSNYKYLGITLNCHLDYNYTTDILTDSAGRALGSIVCKMIKNQGFSYPVYTKLIDACVNSIADYAGEVIGYKSYISTEKLYLRGARAFIGLPKTAPTHGIIAEINWLLPEFRKQIKMIRFYSRLQKLDSSRILKRVYLWDQHLNDYSFVNTWSSEVKQIFVDINQPEMFYNICNQPVKCFIDNLKALMLFEQQNRLMISCQTFPKLRTFVELKNFHLASPCLTLPLSFTKRSLITKARLGILPLRLETGRYARPCIPADERLCLVCSNPNKEVECIYHTLFSCYLYVEERKVWWSKLLLSENFIFLTKNQ